MSSDNSPSVERRGWEISSDPADRFNQIHDRFVDALFPLLFDLLADFFVKLVGGFSSSRVQRVRISTFRAEHDCKVALGFPRPNPFRTASAWSSEFRGYHTYLLRSLGFQGHRVSVSKKRAELNARLRACWPRGRGGEARAK